MSRAVPATDSGAGSSRANARSAASIACGSPGAAGRAATTSASGSSPARRAAVRSRRRGQLVGPLAVVEKQSKRPIVGQLDDHPPQRVDDLIAARARPARLRQRAVEREPRRGAGSSIATPRAARANSSRAPASGYVASNSSAVAYRTRAPALRRTLARRPQQSRLADAGFTLDQHRAATPGGCGVDDFAEYRELGFSLDQHVHRPICRCDRPLQQRKPGTYRDRYRVPDRRAPTCRSSRLASSNREEPQ